jgi:hypothetical protein
MSMSVEDSTGLDEGFTDWKQFWDSACRDLEHDLPQWPGAPLKAVWIQRFDGNDSRIIAQKDATTYYVVSLGTS